MRAARFLKWGATGAAAGLALSLWASGPLAVQADDGYSQGLGAAKQKAWPMARQMFLSAAKDGRPEAADGSWTPSLNAAYTGYRWALEIPGAIERGRLLEDIVKEVDALHAKGMASPESYFILSQSLTLLRRDDLYEAMTADWKKQGRFTAQADQRVVTEEDKSVVAALKGELLAMTPVKTSPAAPVIRPTADPRPRQVPEAKPAKQGWEEAYSDALAKASAGDWPHARQAFLEAARQRKGDTSEATRIGSGPEPRLWRSGAPYTPLFGAAYGAYRWALEVTDDAERNRLLQTSAAEVEALLATGQHSPEAYFVAGQALVLLRDDARFDALNARWKKQKAFTAKIDPEIVTPEDREVVELQKNELLASVETGTTPAEPPKIDAQKAEPPKNPEPEPARPENQTPEAITPQTGSQAPSEYRPGTHKKPKTDEAKAPDSGRKEDKPRRRRAPGAADTGTGGSQEPGAPAAQPQGALPEVKEIKAADLTEAAAAPAGEVAHIPTKFALLIGNTESAMPEGQAPFAAANTALIKESLAASAGYSPENIDVVNNAGSDQIRAAVEALAQKIPAGATVFLYFCGVGSNVGGSDYLAGSEASDPYQTGSMVKKDDILRSFAVKGARVFAFFECARPLVSGRCFGQEAPTSGSVAQMMGTMEGRGLHSVYSGGTEVGIFALGIKTVLDQFRSSSIPLTEFSWQVFYAMRGGKNALGSVQTPTLPVVVLLEQDARF